MYLHVHCTCSTSSDRVVTYVVHRVGAGALDVRLRAVDADRNLTAGRAELLVETTVGADPQVVLSYPHLHVHMYMESIQIINCS